VTRAVSARTPLSSPSSCCLRDQHADGAYRDNAKALKQRATGDAPLEGLYP